MTATAPTPKLKAYLHIPSEHTEEELMLQSKYEQLKRRKKMLQKQLVQRSETDASPPKISKTPLARDARELAKKLLKAGAIAPITKSEEKNKHQSFKRPCGLERRLMMSNSKTVSSYQPFNANTSDISLSPPKSSPGLSKVKDLYKSFTKGTDDDESSMIGTQRMESKLESKRYMGATIFVCGFQITESILHKCFEKFGTITRVRAETEKNRGFVTFESRDSADKAIEDMDGVTVSGIHLKVDFARKQMPPLPENKLLEASTKWSDIANNEAPKTKHKESRGLVKYDDIDDGIFS